MIKQWLFIIAFCLISFSGFAQFNGKYQTALIAINKDSIWIDSCTIVKSSVVAYIGNQILIEGIDFSINYQTGYFYPLRIKKGSEVSVSYQKINLNLSEPLFKKPRNLQLPKLNGNKDIYENYISSGYSFDLYKNDDLKLNGSLSRGLGFGNNQNIVLNSNLNLQMAGKINHDINVLAAISDDNNPIQPEGNTQQLQDFDKVFVQVYKDKYLLTVGDFEMHKPQNSYFMSYYKKSRGLQASSSFVLPNKNILSVTADGALSRGKFVRNVINGIEGNQGPYRLSGSNGELYIIVISGTEAVYLDGQKLSRGEQNDYVIDYNTGEITFMPSKPITQYSRIVVEFQFSDKNYARTLFHTQVEYQTKKSQWSINFYTEQDDKNQPFLQNLNDSAKQILSSIGNRLDEAVISSESQTAFDNKKILYVKKDTLIYSNIYVYAAEKGNDSLFYEVRFSFVGQGKGNYKQLAVNANGRVYVWVEPIGGIPQGDYEPIVLLVTPKKKQMLTIGNNVAIGKSTTMFVEAAASNNNLNTFSDNTNSFGVAFKTKILNSIPLSLEKDSNAKWLLLSALGYEYNDDKFRGIERYRSVEFDRTWNRLLINSSATKDTGYNENILSWRSTIQKGNSFNLFYEVSWYNRLASLNGLQQQTGLRVNKSKNILYANAEWTNTSVLQTNSNVSNYKAGYSRIIHNIVSGITIEDEKSLFRKNSDSLLSGSYAFQQLGWFLHNMDTSQLKYKLEYTYRSDLLPVIDKMSASTVAQSVNIGVELIERNSNRLTANITYREFEIKNTGLTSANPEQTMLSRIMYDYSFLKRVIVANTYYQIGSGQELRRDYQFVEVLPGQGQYIWKDFNANSKPELNEFMLASVTDKYLANYIKIFLPTNSFIGTHSNQFNQTLNINPAAVWHNRKGIVKHIAKFSNLTAVKFDRKTLRLSLVELFNPFANNFNDTALITYNSLLRNTFFFNRSNPTFGMDWNFQQQNSRVFLTNGFETRNRVENTFNIRWNINSSWSIINSIGSGNREYLSDFFSASNYNYVFYEVKPKLSYQVSTQIRLTANYGHFEGTNQELLGGETAVIKEQGVEIRYSLMKQGVLNAKYSNYLISYNGDAQNPLGYDMLQGLMSGENAVWSISLQQRIGTNLQLNVSYDGKSSEGQKVIHLGRMEARYLF